MSIETDRLDASQLSYNDDGLIPAIIQDADSDEVLMMAWMDQIAVEKTIETKDVWFYSRSRKKYWRKGEESGNTLLVKSIAYDCDADALLMQCTIAGDKVACHTGQRKCFYRTLCT